MKSNLSDIPVSFADYLQAKHMGQWNITAKGLCVDAQVNPVPRARGEDLTYVSNILHPMITHTILQERGYDAYQTDKQK